MLADLPALARWHADAEFVRRYDARPAFPATEGALADWLTEQQRAPNAYVFAIWLLEGDELIGYLEVEGILWAHRVGGLSIAIPDRAQQGHGYGREALQLALGFCFRELNLERVQLTVFSYNERAIRLYEGLGFQREGIFREFLLRDGRRYDMLLYGLLRREWQGA